MGDPAGVLGSWLQPWPVLIVAVIWGARQQMAEVWKAFLLPSILGF